ncbi:ATP-binding protein [Streptosporangium vulgare]|uniref:ATP-binding protein n=1 Tax=Streptosporangium vulgare TaxID=46190 RepID=UPI0031D23C94
MVEFRPAGVGRLDDWHVMARVLLPGSVSRRARILLNEVLSRAGVDAEALGDAENAVAELAANAEEHACGPFELRVVFVDGSLAWCEVVDGDRDLGDIPAILDRLRSRGDEPGLDLWEEHGRGLLLVYLLSKGCCQAYSDPDVRDRSIGKAVVFALPWKADAHLPPHPWAAAFPDHRSST